ncbi:MAG: trifunctional transcriptional activator/DNA repair protein Ada/methylated-DNA--[protein]-cysteine S-methyltransferase, partial [Robiginitomaculum sp.]
MTLQTLSHDAAYAVIKTKDISYDGKLFVGVVSTGIFCRPACPARLPLQKNCQFFSGAQEALAAGFRACKRCHPAALPGAPRALVKRLIALVEDQPERRWGEADLRALAIDPSTARRQFRARFGLSFSAYARQRRLGLAAQNLSGGANVIEAQLMAGYQSASGFRAAFGKAFGAPPAGNSLTPLLIDWLDSPLGPILVVCDERALYMVEFTARKLLDTKMARLSIKTGRVILPGRTPITAQIGAELKAYFSGALHDFKTPLRMIGTDFQKRTWRALMTIPYGQTWTYKDLAIDVGSPKGARAVAGANANNTLAIIIP